MSGILFITASAAVSFVLSAVLLKIMIPQEKIKSFSNAGTSFLFGGIPIILAVCLSAALILGINSLAGNYLGIEQTLNTKLWAGILTALCFAAAGFADDNTRFVKNSVQGIDPKMLTAIQVMITAVYMFVLFFASGKAPYIFIPFIGNVYSRLLFWISGLLTGMGSVNAFRTMNRKDPLFVYLNIMSFAAMCIIAFFRHNTGGGIICAAAAGGMAAFSIYKGKFPSADFGTAACMFTSALLFAGTFLYDCPFLMLLLYAVYIFDCIYFLMCKAMFGKGQFLYMKLQKYDTDSKLIVLIYLAVNLVFCTAGTVIMIL